MNYTKGDYTKCYEDICEIWYEDNLYCIVRTENADKILEVLNENEQLKQEVENIKDANVRCCNDYSHYRRENEQLKSENNMLKVTIGRNEAYIKRLTETSIWRC